MNSQLRDVLVGIATAFLIALTAIVLFGIVVFGGGCDNSDDWDGVYYTLDGERCVVDEIVDSETGAVISFCRRESEPEIVDMDRDRVAELHIVWERANAIDSGRCDEILEDGLRIWWVATTETLVPDQRDAVEWWLWPKYFGYATTPAVPATGFGGVCIYDCSSDDGKTWLVVSLCRGGGEFGILAHETAHALRPSLDHGFELDKLIYQLTHTNLGVDWIVDDEESRIERGVVIR